MARIPDRDEYRRKWSGLDISVRRRIVRAVNRGQALEDPREAAVAVATARQQQRFWSRIWLIGPVTALFVIGQGLVVYLVNAGLITGVTGALAWFWYRRAQRAEQLNTEVAAGRRRRSTRRGGNGSHTPRGRRRG